MPLDTLTREYFETLHEVYTERGFLAVASYDVLSTTFLLKKRIEQFIEILALTSMRDASIVGSVPYIDSGVYLHALGEEQRNFLLRHRKQTSQ